MTGCWNVQVKQENSLGGRLMRIGAVEEFGNADIDNLHTYTNSTAQILAAYKHIWNSAMRNGLDKLWV